MTLFTRHFLTALYLALPIVVAGVGHMIVVKTDVLSGLRKPIDAARFGSNKTWRGLLVMPVLTVIGVYVARALEPRIAGSLTAHLLGVSPIVLGLALGLSYALAELPNSYLKRRLGIAPGKLPDRNRFVFAFVDQADSAFGCTLAYALLMPVPVTVLVILVLIGPTIHLIANVGLYSVGLRQEPL